MWPANEEMEVGVGKQRNQGEEVEEMDASNGATGKRCRKSASARGKGEQVGVGKGQGGADFSTSNHSLTPLPPLSLLFHKAMALEMVCNPSANDFASLLPPCF